MSRKKIISLGVIIILGLVILLSKINFNGSAPDLKPWKGDADEILVKSSDYNIRLYKEGGIWLISDKGYPADNDFIESMVKKVRDLKLIDIISEKGYTERYGLTEDDRVHVQVKINGETVRDLYLGEEASTNNHVYLMIDDYPGIYLASGVMTPDFTREVDELSNKVIADVKRDNIESISVKYRGRTYSFYQELEGNSGDVDEEGPVSDTRKWYCRGFGKKEVAPEKINSMLSVFGSLRADTFPEGVIEKSLGMAGTVVKVRAGGRDIELNIYGRTGDGKFYASSTESPYVFTISDWLAERFFIEKIGDIFID